MKYKYILILIALINLTLFLSYTFIFKENKLETKIINNDSNIENSKFILDKMNNNTFNNSKEVLEIDKLDELVLKEELKEKNEEFVSLINNTK